MEIFSCSVMTGGAKCNASCPYCISKMTGIEKMPATPNWSRFKKFVLLAKEGNAQTILFTGKGEPTLYPDTVFQYLDRLNGILWPYQLWQIGRFTRRCGRFLWANPIMDDIPFSFVELQTNGIRLQKMEDDLREWRKLGLNLICLSITHYDSFRNAQIMRHGSKEPLFVIWDTVQFLRDLDFDVRINVTSVKGGIDCIDEVVALKASCKQYDVKHLTIRDVTSPDKDQSKCKAATEWVEKNQVNLVGTKENPGELFKYIEDIATFLWPLPHGARVYDWDGQNINLNDCITDSPNMNEIRQIIFYPSKTGWRIRHDWKYEGAVL